MTDQSVAVGGTLPADRGRRGAVLSLTAVSCVTLLVAILTGSSTLNLAVGGKNASFYWVDLWVLLGFPLYILVVRRGRIPGVRALWILMAVSIGWEVVGMLTAPDPVRGARLLAIHLAGLVVYSFAAFVRLTRREVTLLTGLLLVAPVLMLALSFTSLDALGSSLNLASAAQGRVIESAVGRSNALATLFGAFAVFSLGIWATSSRFRVLASLGLCGAGLGLSLTGSRGGFVATFAGFAAYLWLGSTKGRRTQALLAASLAIALILGLRALGATSTVEGRFSDLEQPRSWAQGPVRNVLIRLDYWRVALLMFRAHPVLGQGLGSFESAYVREGAFNIERSTDPHNQLLLLLGETGLVGAAAAVSLAVFLLRRAGLGAGDCPGRQFRDILLAAVAVAFVHSFAEPVFRNPSSVGLVALLLGLGANPSYFDQLDLRRLPLRRSAHPVEGVSHAVDHQA